MGDRNYGADRGPQDRYRRTVRNERDRTPSHYLGSLGISGQMYHDDVLGTYANVPNAVLRSPIAWIYYIIKAANYGGETVATSTNFGSVDTALNALDAWSALKSGGSGLWESTFVIQNTGNVDDTIDSITADLPTISVPRTPSGAYRMFVWIPRYGSLGVDQWPSAQFYSTSTLDPSRMIALGPEGLAFSMGLSGIEEIYNEIQIEYDYDSGSGSYLRTAKVSRNESDDGFGDPWPLFWQTGVSAAALCDWSINTYGSRKLKLQHPGIHDPRMAVAVGWYHLARFYRPTVRIQFTASPEMSDIQPGHIFRWGTQLASVYGYSPPFWGASETWDNIYFRAIHAEIETGGGEAMQTIVTAEWYPELIGTEVVGGFGGEPSLAGEPVTGVGEVIG